MSLVSSVESEATCYSDAFFDSMEEGAIRSARVVVPIILSAIKPSSVVDVGCGRGSWLKVFREHGISVNGIDGDYVDRTRCLIPADKFLTADLSRPFEIDNRYDLALCLEVAEHLPASMGPHLVRQLTVAAPFVLFSAAIPGQGGTNHINEQWPEYWQAFFSEQGYLPIDFIRPKIRHDRRVECWYRQNIILYASKEAVRHLNAGADEIEVGTEALLEWVHVGVLQAAYDESLRSALRKLPRLIAAAINRRWIRALRGSLR